MQIAMVQLCIIPIPTYVEYVCNSKHLASSVKWDTSYLGMWIRYEAGNCAIVINMKRAFKRCPKRGSMVFHDFELKSNLQQNGHRLNTQFMLITMVQVPPPYLIPSPRYLTKYIVQTSISLILGWYPWIFFCGFNFSLGITKYQSDALSTKPLCPWQRSSTQAAYSGA